LSRKGETRQETQPRLGEKNKGGQEDRGGGVARKPKGDETLCSHQLVRARQFTKENGVYINRGEISQVTLAERVQKRDRRVLKGRKKGRMGGTLT